jgi:hypothetical protein
VNSLDELMTLSSLTAVDDDGIQHATATYARHELFRQLAEFFTQYLSKTLGILGQVLFFQNLRVVTVTTTYVIRLKQAMNSHGCARPLAFFRNGIQLVYLTVSYSVYHFRPTTCYNQMCMKII